MNQRFLLLLLVLVVAVKICWTSPVGVSRVASAATESVDDSEQSAAKDDESAQGKHESWLDDLVRKCHWSVLLLIMAVAIAVLGKSADWLVEEAVHLSLQSGVPRVVVGATAVSLGTTAPEAVVSVLAAFQGEPGLALGNAVGSIICDTGLILGIACIMAPLPINRALVNRQGWAQLGAGVLLIVLCIPWMAPWDVFQTGGRLPQVGGWGLIGLLLVYMLWSVRLAASAPADEESEVESSSSHSAISLLRLIVAVALVVASSSVLISTAKELASRLEVPPSIVAATLVAFGTSLPELIIAITAVRKQQGDLAVGNIIGADILNVLFVAGAAASVTPSGLAAEPHFFRMQFPAMLVVLLMFRIGIFTARKDHLNRGLGFLLLGTYIAVTVLSYLLEG